MPKSHRIGILTAIALLLTLGCSTEAHRSTELVVFAASSLTDAFQEIATAFELENTDVTVTLNFNGSQRLSAQLANGARADLFASANWLQMAAVAESGLVHGDPVNFTSNNLVMIASIKSTQDPNLAYLTQPGVKVVLAQSTVPVGNYSRKVVQNIQDSGEFGPDYAQRVLANLVSEESNVRNVAQKVALGEADAGIVYQTDTKSADIREHVVVVPIPESMNVIADYPVAVMQDSQQKALAQEFVDFLLSNQGQSILQRYGFGSARATNPYQSGITFIGGTGH